MRALGLLTNSSGGGGSPSAPVIAYVDITDGPASGGEGGHGAYINLFGINFGSDINAVSVTINGTAVARKIYLGPCLGRPDIQQLGVQVAAGTTTGPIKVSLSGADSNTDFSFTVRAGNIYFCSPSGSDTTGVRGDITHPYRHPKYLVSNSIVAPGDHIVMLPATYDMVTEMLSGETAILRWLASFNGTGPAFRSALVGYPGVGVVLHQRNGNMIFSNYEDIDYIVVSNMKVLKQDSSGNNAGEIVGTGATQSNAACNDYLYTATGLGTVKHARFCNIGVDGQGLYGFTTSGDAGWIEIQHSDGVEVLGCSLTNTATSSANAGVSTHTLYLSAVQRGAIAAYNYWANIPYGRGILEISADAYTCGGPDKVYKNIWCHGNLFDNCRPQHIVLDGPLGDVWLTANIVRNTVFNTSYAEIVSIRQDTTNDPRVLQIHMHGNTIEAIPDGGLIGLNGPAGHIGTSNEFVNNVFLVSGGGPWPKSSTSNGYYYFETGTLYAPITDGNNCFYGAGALPFFASPANGDINADPMLDSSRRPLAGSLLFGAGSAAGLTKTNKDAYGRIRNPSTPTIGAFEFAA